MFKPFDVFRITDEQPIWIESAPALATAQLRVEALGASKPGEYLIFCHRSGEKISVWVAAPRETVLAA
jgi:hypothetical protein